MGAADRRGRLIAALTRAAARPRRQEAGLVSRTGLDFRTDRFISIVQAGRSLSVGRELWHFAPRPA